MVAMWELKLAACLVAYLGPQKVLCSAERLAVSKAASSVEQLDFLKAEY
jgi:hypothetical protein